MKDFASYRVEARQLIADYRACVDETGNRIAAAHDEKILEIAGFFAWLNIQRTVSLEHGADRRLPYLRVDAAANAEIDAAFKRMSLTLKQIATDRSAGGVRLEAAPLAKQGARETLVILKQAHENLTAHVSAKREARAGGAPFQTLAVA